MLYIPKIDDYLKILTDNEVKDFAVKILVNILNLEKKNCTLKFARNEM